MTTEERGTTAEPPDAAASGAEHASVAGSSHEGAERDLIDLFDALGGAAGSSGPHVWAPYANVNAGTVHGDQRVQNGPTEGAGTRRAARVHEGPVPESEVEAAAFGFAEPAWFGAARRKLDKKVLFLAGRPGSGRRTATLNLLRQYCGEGVPLQAMDSLTELDRWRPSKPTVGGYIVDGLFPARPLGPGVLGHVRSLLEKAGACMVIILPDDTALLRRLKQDLHIGPIMCEPPPPSLVFGSRLKAEVPDERERERLMSAVGDQVLGELLAPELVPTEVVELVTAIVAAGGDRTLLGDLTEQLSFRAEQEVPELVARLRDESDALAFLLAACVYEGLDHRIVKEEADRLLELSEGRLSAVLPVTDPQGGRNEERPNPQFVFRRSLTDLLDAIGASRQMPRIPARGMYTHSVEPVSFIRHRQAEAVLRHVWREYSQVSDLLVSWLSKVSRDNELTLPAGRIMGKAASWGGGRRALRHIGTLADSERTTSQMIAANALGIAAEDPLLVGEVRYRLENWSMAASPYRRRTTAYACAADFGLARPEFALRLLHTLLRGLQPGGRTEGEQLLLRLAVEEAILRLFQSGHEDLVFTRLLEWLKSEKIEPEQLLALFSGLLLSSNWFQLQLSRETSRSPLTIDIIRRALNTDDSFDKTCSALLRWSNQGLWDETASRSVENLFHELARSMRHGELRLFVEIDQQGTAGWAGREIARSALSSWRVGERWESA
ncbi:hypothetical protein GCM10010387_34120 [Streptomyces inusitatus]|uniref:Uncharacterized protein n=1 Tax=Streptomyces inusitatus TaxID=68221 RepID=A0A918Q7S9_9ACTN|nr:hypothetical protein [Streptomyces inusitatus]GGZ37190.1 hypothetical protein GCM10010387_34120 [Streptomyces inusitatus]